MGVIVRKVTAGGSANGTLHAGDKILSINGTSTEAKSYSEVGAVFIGGCGIGGCGRA